MKLDLIVHQKYVNLLQSQKLILILLTISAGNIFLKNYILKFCLSRWR